MVTTFENCPNSRNIGKKLPQLSTLKKHSESKCGEIFLDLNFFFLLKILKNQGICNRMMYKIHLDAKIHYPKKRKTDKNKLFTYCKDGADTQIKSNIWH
jgi:hypothetical protein